MSILKKRLTALFLLCIMAVLALSSATTVFAYDEVDPAKETSLTLNYAYDGKAIANAKFSVYKVASMDQHGELTLTPAFSQYPISITGLTNEEWIILTETLTGYVQRDKLTPTDTRSTDQNGQLKFPKTSVSMKPGLYLVIGESTTVDDYIYKAMPFLVLLPAMDPVHGLNYDVTAKPKCERVKIDDPPLTRRVLKIWDDRGNENKRPPEITVQLLRSGEVYDTVKLNSTNNWRYTWLNLDERYTWTVVEKEEEGYTVKVTTEGITFTITNTYKGNKPPFTPPGKPLPQTGQLWWPVPILSITGLIFVVIGMYLRKEKFYEE